MSFAFRMRLKTQDLKINKMNSNSEIRLSKAVTRKLWNLAKRLLKGYFLDGRKIQSNVVM